MSDPVQSLLNYIVNRLDESIGGKGVAYIATILAIISVALSLWIRGKCQWQWLGLALLLFWSLAPPIWFFLEWIYLDPKKRDSTREYIMHLHDLSRNIWLAFVVVLAMILGIKLSPGE
jgi:hypothetical protein